MRTQSSIQPLTEFQRRGIIAQSFARIGRNMKGDLGPRCTLCDGLGKVFELRFGPGGVLDRPRLGMRQPFRIKEPVTCKRCGGHGLEMVSLDAAREKLWRHLLEQRPKEVEAIQSLYRGPDLKMSRQYWVECISWATATGTPIASTTTETIIMANVTIPANVMQDGRNLRLTLYGSYGTTATPTSIISLRWGGVSGTVMAKSSAVTLTSGVGGGASMTAGWKIEMLVSVRSNGSSGTAMSNGDIVYHTATAATAGTVTHYGLVAPIISGSTGGTTPVAVTCDFTADTALSITQKWSASDPANSFQGMQYTLESMN